MRLKLFAADGERDVAEFLVFEEEPKVVGQSALWYLELYRVALAGDIDAVRNDANLKRQNREREAFFRGVRGFINLHREEGNFTEIKVITQHTKVYTSQNIVSLSSGSRPFASSKRKSLLINFLKPQSLP